MWKRHNFWKKIIERKNNMWLNKMKDIWLNYKENMRLSYKK